MFNITANSGIHSLESYRDQENWFSNAFIFIVILVLCNAALVGSTFAEQAEKEDFTRLNLEQLMNTKVVSVSKRPSTVAQSAAAIYVVNEEEIRRSGATSIPELLRLVPGVQVARIDANKWAITSRGFNGRFANKLLVLIDGRTVYTPLFGGVLWDVQDTILEDIRRIEVIRGPGATLWGANAVNGVINIITKNAKETQGILASEIIGSEQSIAAVRYGAEVAENAYLRVYAKYISRDEAVFSSGQDAFDNWNMKRAGFRSDWQATHRDHLTIQGDVYDGETGTTFSTPTLTAPFFVTSSADSDTSGGNLLTRWKRELSNKNNLALQAYFDWTKKEDPLGSEERNTFDFDFHHQFSLIDRHDLIWGLRYRFSHDELSNSFFASFDPDNRSTNFFSGFLQDEFHILPNSVRLTVGSKFEWNDFTGFEFQPSGRLLWTPNKTHAIWGAVSRAVRTPTRQEEDVIANSAVLPPFSPGNPSPLPVVTRTVGNSDIESEELIAFELGYRANPLRRFSFDVASFYNIYDKLSSARLVSTFTEASPPPIHLVAQSVQTNALKGETYGVEVDLRWRPLDRWRLQATYSYFEMHLSADDNSAGSAFFVDTFEGSSPAHSVTLRSTVNLPHNLDFDLWLRYVDDLPALSVSDYVTLDARLAWRPTDKVEFSLVGQNLFAARHLEFAPQFVPSTPTEVQRAVYGKLTIRH
jgi:iron complex outermembrane receptor protein